MTQKSFSIWRNFAYDFPASVVVFLVALPLCLGIALASGAPLFSGIISGIVGGVVIGALSKSPLSIAGPAAGLTVIVFAAIQELPSFEAFLLAVFLAGALQIVLAFCKAGVIGDFIPSAVIKGMLTAIGIILILKQVPHAIGYDADYEGSHSFWQTDHENTFSAIWHAVDHYTLPGAIVVSGISLLFMSWWDKKQPKLTGWPRYIPGPLVVVAFGILANALFKQYAPQLIIAPSHLVAVPVMHSLQDFRAMLNFPDFTLIADHTIWITAFTLAIVASIESLLCIEAVDKLDPYKRVTPTNRELLAQGAGNMAAGLLGGLPVTSVIVRSSANLSAGGRTQMSAILHGILLLICVISIPVLLNKIPLAALAAILISVGYKLAKPQIFIKKYEMGYTQFVPFITTVAAIILTDLLIGITIGVLAGICLVLRQNFRSALLQVADGRSRLVRLKKDFFFLHKYELRRTLSRIPDDTDLLLDVSRATFIDADNVEIINDFITNAQYRNIRVTLKTNPESSISAMLKEPAHETL